MHEFYLVGFSSKSERCVLWAYEKGTGKTFATQPKNVGAEQNFYPEDVEKFLANAVEGKCNPLLEAIRTKMVFRSEQKPLLATYVLAMIRRVPRHRERLYSDVMPDALENTFHKWFESLEQAHKVGKIDERLYESRKHELVQLQSKYEAELPAELKPEATPPNISKEIVDHIASLNWTFLVVPGPSMLVTGDNPVFYTEGIGMDNPRSELLFPISSRIALWATKTPLSKDCAFCETKERTIHEVNKRIVWNACRFVYYRESTGWVQHLVKKNLHFQYLSMPDLGIRELSH